MSGAVEGRWDTVIHLSGTASAVQNNLLLTLSLIKQVATGHSKDPERGGKQHTATQRSN